MRFQDVTGQEDVKQRLIRTVKNNRVSHAQLFLGPEGSGKLAMAIAYAQFINCTDRLETDSCGECPSCVKYEKLIHPDLHFIYPTARTKEFDKPASKDFLGAWRELLTDRNYYLKLPDWYEKIGIERKQAIINTRDCNDIVKTLGYKSYEADYKVMIIWMVEKLFHAAAPKILKILEEPPEKTLFLLVSENQEQIINTILSRTQLVKISYIKNDSLVKKLIGEGCDAAKVHEAVRIAKGNYIEAKRIIEHSYDEEFNFDTFARWMRLCFTYKVSETVDFISDLSKYSREKQKSFLIYTLRMVRESLLQNLNNGELANLNDRESDFMVKFHPFINENNGPLIAREVNQSVYHIERNANPNILFLDLSLKMGQLLKKVK